MAAAKKKSARKTTAKKVPWATVRTQYAAKRDSDVTKASKALRGKARAIARNPKHAQHAAVTKWFGDKEAGDGNRYPDVPADLARELVG